VLLLAKKVKGMYLGSGIAELLLLRFARRIGGGGGISLASTL
jgi:hypothetical protein